jgi:hypothetical protein
MDVCLILDFGINKNIIRAREELCDIPMKTV